MYISLCYGLNILFTNINTTNPFQPTIYVALYGDHILSHLWHNRSAYLMNMSSLHRHCIFSVTNCIGQSISSSPLVQYRGLYTRKSTTCVLHVFYVCYMHYTYDSCTCFTHVIQMFHKCNIGVYSQRRVQPDQCYFIVQITGVCSVIQQSYYVLHFYYTLYDGKYDCKITTH